MTPTVEKIVKLFEADSRSARSLLLEMGFSETALNEWKRGKAKPTTEALTKIAKHFKVSTDYLLGLTDNPTIFTDADRASGVSEHGKVTVDADELELLDLYNTIGHKFGKERQETVIKLLTAMADEEKM